MNTPSPASARSKSLSTSFPVARSDKLVILFPSESSVEAAGKEWKIGRRELRWEGQERVELRGKDPRREVALVILQPLDKDETNNDEKQYEAFLYVGSHTP
ncbi:hypothetical protein JCM10295v2_000826 [Rhodotorula toruloides]